MKCFWNLYLRFVQISYSTSQQMSLSETVRKMTYSYITLQLFSRTCSFKTTECIEIKRSVMITSEKCPKRAEISTHKHLGKCIYLLFVWLAVIGLRQNYFYILPNFGDFGAKMSFFHYIINQKRNNFIKHCSPQCTKKPLISEMCIYIKSSLCKWGLGTRGGGNDVL